MRLPGKSLLDPNSGIGVFSPGFPGGPVPARPSTSKPKPAAKPRSTRQSGVTGSAAPTKRRPRSGRLSTINTEPKTTVLG